MKKYFVLMIATSLGLFSINNALCDESNDFLFSTPIIYQPMIEGKRIDVPKPINEVLNIPQFSVAVKLSSRKLSKEDEYFFDQHLIFEYENKENIIFHLYMKNNMIIKIIKEQNGITEKQVYKRNLEMIRHSLKNAEEGYRQKSEEILRQILCGEDILSRLPQGRSSLSVKLSITEDVTVGEVHFSAWPETQSFSFLNGQMQNMAVTRKIESVERIRYSISYYKGIITLANVYNEDITHGYDCSFYENFGLKFFLPMTDDGKFKWIDTWDLNGKNGKKVLLDDWIKQQKR